MPACWSCQGEQLFPRCPSSCQTHAWEQFISQGLLPQLWILLLLFLIWLLWIELPILCWTEVVNADTLVLFLILVGKLLVFPIEYDVGYKSLIYDLYYVEECSLYSHFDECFYINGCCTFSNVFSSSIYMNVWFLSLLLFMWCVRFIDLQILYHPCIHGINPTWSWCMTFLMYS